MNPEFVIRSFTAFLDANKIPAASVLPTVVSCLIDEKFYIATPKLLIEASKISRRSGTMARLKFRVAEQLMREYDAVEGEDFFNIRYHQLNEDLLALYRKGEIPRAAC